MATGKVSFGAVPKASPEQGLSDSSLSTLSAVCSSLGLIIVSII